MERSTCLHMWRRWRTLPACNPSTAEDPPRLPKGFEPDNR